MKKNHRSRTYQAATTPPRTKKPIGLALQGGGSWGAYTLGVLDALLLASRTVAIAQLSGTSAGAINAAIVASALANGLTGTGTQSRCARSGCGLADPALADIARRDLGAGRSAACAQFVWRRGCCRAAR